MLITFIYCFPFVYQNPASTPSLQHILLLKSLYMFSSPFFLSTKLKESERKKGGKADISFHSLIVILTMKAAGVPASQCDGKEVEWQKLRMKPYFSFLLEFTNVCFSFYIFKVIKIYLFCYFLPKKSNITFLSCLFKLAVP